MTPKERAELISRYKGGYDEVLESLGGFTDEELSARPLPGKWTAREIVHHLADSEMTSAVRLRKLLAEESPQIQGYDQDAFAERLGYNGRPVGPALDALRAARATTAQLLDSMTDEDWSRAGTHSESGRYGAEDWLRIYAAHAHDHAAQIRRLRAALDEAHRAA
ncbi:MAG TPA: DinB family protein [Pyrinomonadaceae bacterium]|nr:DinB family protein [Pyrinomonadaceae bacterium]